MNAAAETMAARLRLTATLALARGGAWTMLALSAVASAALLHALLVVPAQEETARLQSEAARREAAALRVPAPSPAASTAASSEHVPALLPPASRLANDLELLFRLARSHQLQAPQAQYQRGPARAGEFESVHVDLPLAGSYVNVRGWVEAVLRSLPHASIDQLAFEREHIARGQIVARVRVTLWLRPEANQFGAAREPASAARAGNAAP
jgi:hypothetical protein